MLLDLWGLIQKNLFRGANSGKGRIVIVEIEGNEFRVPEGSLQSFLKAFERREVKRVNKVVRSTIKQEPVVEKVPTVAIKEVPDDIKQEVVAMIDNTSLILEALLEKLRLKRLQDEEDEIILLLLGA